MSIIADRLTKAMRDKGLTNRELSKISGVPEYDISHYRKGHYSPKRDRIFKLADALDVSPVWLSGLDLTEQTFSDLWSSLNHDNQIQARNYILYLLAQQEKENV